MEHIQQPYAQTLDEVRAARSWLDGLGIVTAGSRVEAIESTIAALTADLAALPPEEVVARWDWANRRDAYYALTEGTSLARVHQQLSKLGSHSQPRGELKRAVLGPLVPTDEQAGALAEPRNLFLELDLAAAMMAGGIEVTGFDDVRFTYDKVRYVVQCKRPFGYNSVKANVEGAWSQLDKRAPAGSHIRGVIALGVDKVLGLDRREPIKVQNAQDVDAEVTRLTHAFVGDHEWTWRSIIDGRCVAVVLVFRFVVHTLPPANTISAVRYEVLCPTAAKGTSDRKRVMRLARAMKV